MPNAILTDCVPVARTIKSGELVFFDEMTAIPLGSKLIRIKRSDKGGIDNLQCGELISHKPLLFLTGQHQYFSIFEYPEDAILDDFEEECLDDIEYYLV
jgi:hypothetical protein